MPLPIWQSKALSAVDLIRPFLVIVCDGDSQITNWTRHREIDGVFPVIFDIVVGRRKSHCCASATRHERIARHTISSAVVLYSPTLAR